MDYQDILNKIQTEAIVSTPGVLQKWMTMDNLIGHTVVNLSNQDLTAPQVDDPLLLTYCAPCLQAWEKTAADKHEHSGECLEFGGVSLLREFVSEDEEKELVAAIDRSEWTNSQSGRRKQDYGPKVNFKKKKIKSGVFTGLPSYTQSLIQKMSNIPVLQTFRPVELCNLEYIPERGSSIDPHFDDFWLWGERLVTLNLLSDTTYTMTQEKGKHSGVTVKIPFPRRALLVLQGPARHQWQHSICRGAIQERRIGITVRELTAEFLEGGAGEAIGKCLLDTAGSFQGISVAEYEKNTEYSEDLVKGCR